ncbi:MAG: hypothetical protein IJ410_05940 [Oscillospiraceae bacterium]|nr:hypothetical protein [Oscillospiraceae bacterium]
MDRGNYKYNDNIARYIAMQVIQNRYNKNRGMTYRQAVKKYARVKRSIDYWLEKTDPQETGEEICK